jgi:hypothetical protein
MMNDSGFVELSLERLGENFDLDDFVYAIRANHTVRHVCFSGTFVRQLESSQWRTMLESIGFLSTLEELQIWCSTIPIDSFLKTIARATRLRKVYFFRVQLEGTQVQFDEFADCLKRHSSLGDFRFGGFQLTENISLDSVVEALAEVRTLEVVNLQLTGSQAATTPFSCRALSKLLSSPSITDLYLSRLALSDDHLMAIAACLRDTSVLRVLDLFGNSFSDKHLMLISNALLTNSGLQTLVLPCPIDAFSVETCAAVSLALQSNKTLLRLSLPCTKLCDDGLLHIAEGLTVNTTLKKIEVGLSKEIGDKGLKALQQMLEKNYQLERLLVPTAEKGIQKKVEHYMRLNEVGRGSLLRDGKSTREQWVEMLISVRNDLDCLFYFTSMNPSICQFANTR